MKIIEDKQLNNIIEERLHLQTTQRYLEANDIKINSNFLKTKRFKEKYDSWPQYKKYIFLKTVAGIYWKKMKEKIENELLQTRHKL